MSAILTSAAPFFRARIVPTVLLELIATVGTFVGDNAGKVSQVVPGEGIVDRGDVLWSADGDQFPAIIACEWSEIDDPICVLDQIQMMLDQENRVAVVNQAMQHSQ